MRIYIPFLLVVAVVWLGAKLGDWRMRRYQERHYGKRAQEEWKRSQEEQEKRKADSQGG